MVQFEAYIVKWDKANDYVDDDDHNIVNPVFNNVTITNEDPAEKSVTSLDGYVTFVGTYSPIGIYTAEKTNLYLSSSNELNYPTQTDQMVNACRAYFKLNNGLTAGEPDSSQQTCVRAFVLSFDDNSETTRIILMENGKWDSENENDAWYTIDGRKLQGKPATPGI